MSDCNCDDVTVCYAPTVWLSGVKEFNTVNLPPYVQSYNVCGDEPDYSPGKRRVIYTNKLILANLPCGIGCKTCGKKKKHGCDA